MDLLKRITNEPFTVSNNEIVEKFFKSPFGDYYRETTRSTAIKLQTFIYDEYYGYDARVDINSDEFKRLVESINSHIKGE